MKANEKQQPEPKTQFRGLGRWIHDSPEPPHSEEAEKGLLGSLLLDALQVMELCIDGGITVGTFFFPVHGMIYGAVQRMLEADKPVDLITLTNFLRDDGQLDTVGGAAALTSLISFVPTSANAAYYIDIIRRKSLRRMMMAAANELGRAAQSENADEYEILDAAQAQITALSETGTQENPMRHIRPDIQETLDYAEKIYARRGDDAIHGLATGFIDFDRMTGGLIGGQLVVFAGRPAMGKTAIAMNIAEYVALEKHLPVAIFSLEMSRSQMARRLLSSTAMLPLERWRNGFFAAEDFPNMTKAASKLATAPIFMDATPALRTDLFRARARRLKAQAKIKLIIVDYVQLMKSPSKRAQENRVLEMSEITAVLKQVAKELDVPVIALAQLNREVERRAVPEPRLMDLRESGSIENDADIVGLLFRKHYYTDEPEDEGLAQVIIAKHRDGPPGTINLGFVGALMRFQNLTPKLWSNKPEERQQNVKKK